ncbi:unnamed protein product [Adineta steineri]|uniref:G-protein coupled receptors family 1 profile domain-containing protein n=1 Tax=Adineta steineri TaxID=433720 RepID=A0A818H960_9BILA|nr:unnamed protein product [Adineta steineri]CAF3504270.1 unnamed protein product [Adineta steineri]
MHINLTRISIDVSDNDCILYRFISIIFICISITSFTYNIRFISTERHRLNPLALSLIVNSLVLTIFSSPYVLTQSIKCTPIQSYFICSSQGFICFTCGICVMYTMCLLSFIQYIRLFYNSTIIYRIINHRNSFLIPFLCWFISLLWSFPPYMNIKPGFMREGQGFDCGLNWRRIDIESHIYMLLAFIFIYFLPLFCLLYTHIRMLIAIRKLVYRRYPIISQTTKTMSIDMRHRFFHIFTIAESNRLKRLRIYRRFARATMITVFYYILAWTPYAICGILQIIFAMKYIHFQLPPMLLTLSALIAKMAVIGQSCIYFYTIQPANKRFSLTSATLK